MNHIISKLIILFLSACTAVMQCGLLGVMAPIYVTASFALLAEIFGRFRRVRVIYPAAYVLLCFYYQPFVFMLPLVLYDCLPKKISFICLAPAALLTVSADDYPAAGLIVFTFLCLMAAVLKLRDNAYLKHRESFIRMRDDLTETSIRLRDKVAELDEQRETAIGSATLAERGRIARDIHDSVGHLLSSAILQLGALLAVTKDEAQRQSLIQLKDTLTAGMNEIRESVHDLRDNSVDLYTELKALADGFCFCPVTLEYELSSEPEAKRRYAVIAIVKEALANVMKHSDATRVTISLFEHPALYQLIIQDNGNPSAAGEGGMGLQDMKRRAEEIGGICNISTDNGFRIFISFRKEQFAS